MSNRSCIVRCVPLSYDVEADTVCVASPSAPQGAALTLPMDCLINVGDGADAMAKTLRGVIARHAAEALPSALVSVFADKVIADFMGEAA